MWLFQRFRLATSQHDDQKQHPDSPLQSVSSVENVKQVQFLAKDLENLVISSKDEVIDRYIHGESVAIDKVEQVKLAVDDDDDDDDHRHLVVKEAVNEVKFSRESEEKSLWDVKEALKVATTEFRVSEERETGERCEIREDEADDERVYEHKNGDLKEKNETEIEDRNASFEIGSYVNNGGDGWDEGSVSVPDDGKLKDEGSLRLDCSNFTRTGMCKFGSNCRFNHPLIDKIQSTKETKKKMEENMERHGPIECKPTKETKKEREKNAEGHGPVECKPTEETKKEKEKNAKRHGSIECKLHEIVCEHKDGDLKEKHEILIEDRDVSVEIGWYENNGGDGWEDGLVGVPDDGKSKSKAYHDPLRPDCSYYTREMCKFGSNCKLRSSCKFNHPLIGKIQPAKETEKKMEENTERHGRIECKPTKETKKKKEDNVEKNGPIECKLHEIVYEHKDGDLKEKHEILIEDRDVSVEIGWYENNGGDGWGGDGWEDGSVGVPDDGKSKSKAYHYPLRPDCSYYTREMCKFGSNCKFRSSCKFNHPLIGKIQPAKETKKKMEENTERHGRIECKPTKETKKKKEDNVEKNGPIECKPTKETKKKKEEYVERSMRHKPIECKPSKETKKKKEENKERHGPIKSMHPTKETKKKKEENVEKHGPTECKNHMSSAGCKYGKACKFNHRKGKNVKTPVVQYNFVDLPIRPGKKECPYYMRNGFCQHGRTCRLHHPDPVAVEGVDAPTSYGNDNPLPFQPASQPNIPNISSWSPPRTPDPTAAFVPMMYSPTQNMPPPNPDWYGFQAPAHLYPSSEQGPPVPPAFFPNNLPSDTNMYTHHQQPTLVSEYPERLDQPDCRHFMKTGVCKNWAACKFRHPQSQITQTSRDQNICTNFSRHGTCKYGPACKYDHPVNSSNSSLAGEGYDESNGPDL